MISTILQSLRGKKNRIASHELRNLSDDEYILSVLTGREPGFFEKTRVLTGKKLLILTS